MDDIKSINKSSKPRQKVKFEGESELEEIGSNKGVKGWLDGDYKVGDINIAIVKVTDERQV